MGIDFEKAKHLLDIAEKAVQFGQRFRFLHNAALEELDKMDPTPKPEPTRMPPIEKAMRGETASTYAEQGKDEDPKPEPAPKRLPGSESYFEATKEERR